MAHQGKVCCAGELAEMILETNFFPENSTPLHLAARVGHPRCVRFLLDHGADINAANIRQRTPINTAASVGSADCLMMMLQHSGDCADVSTATHSQDTALIACFHHGEQMRDCITELVHRGADVSCSNSWGMSAVYQAVYYNWDMDMMTLLIVQGRGMDFDRIEGETPLEALMERQVWHYRDGVPADPPEYTDQDEDRVLLFLRMGATRKDLKRLLWHELNLPKPPGVLLETLMASFDYLPSLSALDADRSLKPLLMQEEDCTYNLWDTLDRVMSEEARLQEEKRLEAIIAEKKSYYHRRSREVPSLLHLCRSAIRSNLQADVRGVISWPVPQCFKRYILLGHEL